VCIKDYIVICNECLKSAAGVWFKRQRRSHQICQEFIDIFGDFYVRFNLDDRSFGLNRKKKPVNYDTHDLVAPDGFLFLIHKDNT
jgi:hypothetical protein